MKDSEIDQYLGRIETAFQTTMHTFGHLMAKHMNLNVNVTGAQFYILRLLTKKGTLTASELAHALSVKPSAVTAMIDRLHKSGFVKRERDEADRRVVFISITEDGRAIYEKAERSRKKVMTHYFGRLERDELEALSRIYEKLATIVTDVEMPDPEED